MYKIQFTRPEKRSNWELHYVIDKEGVIWIKKLWVNNCRFKIKSEWMEEKIIRAILKFIDLYQWANDCRHNESLLNN
jgi:hypothetical protein